MAARKPDIVFPRGAPIGVFDSGVGGLSVLRHIRNLLPHEDLIYCADSRYAPYGDRPEAEICGRSGVLSAYLSGQGCKAIVVACNTATAAAVSLLRQQFAVPVIGMEPAVKPAVAASRRGIIGVLATTGTLQSARFAALLDSYGSTVTIITQGCPGLVELVETAQLHTPEADARVHHYVRPLLQAGADTIVLGCTHYPFLRHLVARHAGASVTLVDTGEAVARQVKNWLGVHLREPNDTRYTGRVRIITNSASAHATDCIRALWDEPAEIVQINSDFTV